MDVPSFLLEMEEFDESIDAILSQMEMPDLDTDSIDDFKNFYAAPRRFSEPVSSKELLEHSNKGYAENTKKRIASVLRLYNAWVTERNGSREFDKVLQDLLKLGKDQLCQTLCKFILEVRKETGEDYPKETLLDIVCNIQMYFHQHSRMFKFLSDPEFVSVKNTLDNCMKELTKQGKVRQKKAADPLTLQDQKKIWESEILGDKDLETLVNTVMFLLGTHLSLRAVQKHKNLKVDLVVIKYDPKLKLRFLEYKEVQSKNNQGGLHSIYQQQKCVPVYENVQKPERCAVKLFEQYLSRRPQFDPKCSRDLYLRLLGKTPKTNIWYSCQPMGVHSISKVVKRMTEQAGLTGNFSNHSCRATAPTLMYREGMDEQRICELTGHRSIAV